MEEYRIGTIAKLTGLTVHNLRAWEKRHQAFTTDRTESGRRVYSEETLNRLKLLKACVDQGMSISTIANLGDSELKKRLEQFSVTTSNPLPRQAAALTVVGEPLAKTVEREMLDNPSVKIHQRFADLDELIETNKNSIEILLLEQASLSATEAKLLGETLKSIEAQHKVLVYRYARQQDITHLRTLGVHAVKAPVDREILLNLFERLKKPMLTLARSTQNNEIPARIYSDVDINKAAALSSAIDCECPQHMAEIIKCLVDFEVYSSQCLTQDQASADMHRFIYQRTAQARAIMEDLMQAVLQQEGIDLELVAV